MNAFFGEVNEMRVDDDMEDVDALSSDGPAPIDRSYRSGKYWFNKEVISGYIYALMLNSVDTKYTVL